MPGSAAASARCSVKWIGARTVTSHLDHIYTRLDIDSRSALATALAKRGLA